MRRFGIRGAAMFAEPTITEVEEVVRLVHGNGGQWPVVSGQISKVGGQNTAASADH
jgi:hypothetical protein